MPKTPDRHPGPLYEEGIYLDVAGVSPSANGELRYVSGVGFQFHEEGVLKGLTGTGLSESQHRALRQLIHFIDDGPAEGFASGAYKETLPAANPFPTSFIWWTSAAKTNKIVELTVTYNSNKTPATEVWKVYDSGGTLLATVTDTPTYSGVFEVSRTRTIS